MIAIITEYGDYDIAITWDEYDKWSEESPIVGELLTSDVSGPTCEQPTGKLIRLVYKPNAKELVNRCVDADDWDEIKTVELICNKEAYECLDNGQGKVYTEIGTINVLVQTSNALGAYN